MSRNKGILIIGILVILMPFLGFPSSWKTFFYLICGAILIIMAVVGHVRRRSPLIEGEREVITEVYVSETGEQR